MSRFYKTSASNPIDWAYELPYKEMLQGLQMKQAAQDAAVGAAGKMLALGDELRYLEPDRQAALAQVDWLNKGIDSLVNSDLTDPTNRAKLRDFSREVARRWGRSGIVGNIQAAYDANQAYLKELAKNEKLSQEQKRMAPVFSMSQYQGVGDETPYGGTYNTFRGVTPSDFVDVATEWAELAREVEKDVTERGGSKLLDMYIKDWDSYKELPNAQRLKRVWDLFTQREDVRNYLSDGIAMGYARDMDMNSIFQGGIAQQGITDKYTAKLKNDSWQNTKAGWEREDSNTDLYTQLYDEVYTNGKADLTNTPVASVYPDKVISSGTAGYLSMSPQLDDKITKIAKENNLPFDLVVAYLNQEKAPNYSTKQQATATFTAMKKGKYAPYMNTTSLFALKNIAKEVGDEFKYLPPLAFEGEGLASVDKVHEMFTIGGQAFNRITVTIKPDADGKYGGKSKQELQHAGSSGSHKGTFNADGSFTTQTTVPYKFSLQKQNKYNSGRGASTSKADQNNLKRSVVSNQIAQTQDALQQRFMDEVVNSATYTGDNPKRVIVKYSPDPNVKPVYELVTPEERALWEQDETNKEITNRLLKRNNTSYIFNEDEELNPSFYNEE